MDHRRKAEQFDVMEIPEAGTASAVMCLPSVISEVRIHGTFGSYHISWDGEIHDLDLPPLDISDGPYMTFKGALRAARRKIRKDRRKLHERIINAQWERQS
jgi:hypothetical protein